GAVLNRARPAFGPHADPAQIDARHHAVLQPLDEQPNSRVAVFAVHGHGARTTRSPLPKPGRQGRACRHGCSPMTNGRPAPKIHPVTVTVLTTCTGAPLSWSVIVTVYVAAAA